MAILPVQFYRVRLKNRLDTGKDRNEPEMRKSGKTARVSLGPSGAIQERLREKPD